MTGKKKRKERSAAEVVLPFGQRSRKGQETAAQRQGKVGSGTLGTGMYELLPADEIPKLMTGHIDFLQIRTGTGQ